MQLLCILKIYFVTFVAHPFQPQLKIKPAHDEPATKSKKV